MTTEQPLPMSPQTAVADAHWYAEHSPGDLSEITEVVRAAETLALVVERVLAMRHSSIGADDLLSRNRYDTPSFYAGVAFALERVNGTLAGWDKSR